MAINLLGLDFDGTVINSLETCYQKMVATFNHLGINAPPLKIWKEEISQIGVLEFYIKYGAPKTLTLEELHEIYTKIYKKLEPKPELFPGVAATLSSIFKKGIPIVLISLNSQAILEAETERLGIAKYFSKIIGQTREKEKELIKIIQNLRIRARTVLFVGDTVHDIEAAKKAGCISIAFINSGSFHCKQDLEKTDPDYIIYEFDQLLPLVF